MDKLSQISEAWLNALSDLPVDENGEIDTAELDRISEDFAKKVEAIGMIIKQSEAMAKLIKEEEQALASRRKTLENNAAWLKNYLTENFHAVGQTKLDTPKVRIFFNPKEAVEILDEAMVPDEYKVQKITSSISKTLISDAINAGTEVPGAVIVTHDNIQVK